MLCNQCEQTPDGGCTVRGVCGKEDDINSMQELILYALKGVAAYDTEARNFGYSSELVNETISEALYTTLTNVNFDPEQHLDLAMDVGEAAIEVMEQLDRAHTEAFGLPEPAEVPQNDVDGHAILVTGHDLHALDQLLDQADGEDVTVYTHSEMLPAHGYPRFANDDQLRGNIGGAWYDQRTLFDEFPGVVVGTSNCVQPPKDEYADRMYTHGVAGLDGTDDLPEGDFTPAIEHALETPAADWNSDERITTGYHHQNVVDMAPQIVDAVEDGDLSHFFVIGGCDAPTPGRSYYRELAQEVPEDCVIMTTSCGKFRFNDLDFGTVPGTDIPRYIDLGQCNDSISTVKIASALAEEFDCAVGDLPVSIALSWFEQKAVAILLGLFSLGIEDVRLGPSLPEFVTPEVAETLQAEFGLQPIGDARSDLEAMLGTGTSSAASAD
ncbi:hydroxylamine reductase [Halorientalis brevis]|uniref:Hydroxylamine reductase n=1 Tax=Halorientalis brevis TaxID=1126241 RepID=A0ABD6C9Y6_9EURY|nr:hydroxylamine reductase [Halorientalis brevis]